MTRLRCFSSPRYYIPLPAGHVFPMRKFPETVAKLTAEGTVQPDQILDPGFACDRDLLRCHTPEYLHSIRSGMFNEQTALRLGLPPSEALSARSHCAVNGTVKAARAALEDGIACNLAGGTHHAFADRGEGFCVLNDVAVAFRALQADEPYLHAFVIDLDAHQGNGTHALLANDPCAFTYSVHVGKNYPSRKVPGSMDVELSRWAGADEYFTRLESTLPTALQRFEPDLAFYIAGVDVHEDDRFGQMKLTTQDMLRRDRYVLDLCRNWSIPVAVLYGGGYNRAEGMTTELHCQTIRQAARRMEMEIGSQSVQATT